MFKDRSGETPPSGGRFPPQKGDVWTWHGNEYVFTGETKIFTCSKSDGPAYLAQEPEIPGELCNWYQSHFFDGYLTFVRFSEEDAISWDDWLPPRELPEVPYVKPVKGEIWAFWDPSDNERCVIEICDKKDAHRNAKVLAGKHTTCELDKIIWFTAGCSRLRWAIKIANAGETPRDPDLIYQFLYMEPKP